MIFVFDIDDTISETDKCSDKYIAKFLKDSGSVYKRVRDVARFTEMKFDWPEDVALKWYKTYGDQMAEQFNQKRNAVEILTFLHNKGHKIVLATARSTDWHTDPEGMTMRWLKAKKVPYDKIYLGRVDKEKICIDEHADVFVDDDIEICERVARDCKNTKVFLMNSDFNKTQYASPNLQRIDNLSMVLALMKTNKLKKAEPKEREL